MRVFFALCLLASCGYGMRRQDLGLRRSGGEEGPARIFVPVVDNSTTRTGFEPSVTNSLRLAVAGLAGVELARDEAGADYLLLATVTGYEESSGPTTISGHPATQNAGGLRSSLSTSGDIRLVFAMQVKLAEKLPGETKVRRTLWDRVFRQEALYEASNRYYETATGAGLAGAPRSQGGSSSASYINASRSSLLLRALADKISLQIVDQVAQDF
jgi:hypothetical protein